MRISFKADAAASKDPQKDALIKQLTEAASKLGLVVGIPEGNDKPKYGAQKIVLGRPKMAATGIATFVNYPGGLEALQKKASEGVEAVKEEFLASCPGYDIKLLDYVLDAPAGSNKQKYQNGWMCDCEQDVVLVDDPLTLTAPSVGARVKLHSLQGKPEHNGVEGEVLEFDASAGRWKVQLHPDGPVLALKASNLAVEGGIVVEKGVKGKVLETAKDGDTWPEPPSWGGARIDFGGTIGVQWVSKDQFQSLAGVVLPSRQIADPAAAGGKRGMPFKDFCDHKVAKDCNLTPAMVLLLRLYTTWVFVNINSPLRDPDLMDQKTSHKLGASVYLLSEAVKQSPATAADSPEANVPLSLFRGIKERDMPNEFTKLGGTELAPMSTVRTFCDPHMLAVCRITEFPHRRHWSTCGADILRLCADGRALGCAQILAGRRQFGAAVAAHPELHGQGRGPDLDLCFPS